MMAIRSLAVATAIVASACSVEHTMTASRAIVGGGPSDPNEFPATGMLVVGDRLQCTATLIAPDVALTAAHCLHQPVFGTLGFTLDADASDGTADVIPIALFHPHPDFDEGVDAFLDLAVRNDIGILILERPVPDVVPERVDTPLLETAIGAGDPLALCGYGWTFWLNGSVAVKRDAEVFVDRAKDYEFSTTPVDPQPCVGDSGGPLFVDGPDGRRIVGVVSRAVGTSRMCDTGAIITRVAPYAAWIAEASRDRDRGCSAGGGGGSMLPLGVLGVLYARRRRRPPR
jgi:uncharacterized protein (TIGR03382 family)